MIQERLISTPLMQFDHLFHESNNSLESFVCTSSCVFLEEEGGEWVIEKEMRRGGGDSPPLQKLHSLHYQGIWRPRETMEWVIC